MIGTISEFNSSVDDWDVYYERLEQFFDVNDVPEAKRSAFLISVIGADAYKSLRDLCHPVAPRDKPFTGLCELLRKQFSPQISIFRERAKFYNSRQEYHENATQWYGKLKRLSVNCKFGESLQTILMDKFITGLRPGQVLDRLCEENEALKLELALDIAVNKECAAKENAYAPQRPCYRPQVCPVPQIQKCFFGGQPVRMNKPEPEKLFSNTFSPAPKSSLFGQPGGSFGGSGGISYPQVQPLVLDAPASFALSQPLATAAASSLFGKTNENLEASGGAGFALKTKAAPPPLFSAPAVGFGAPAPCLDSAPMNLKLSAPPALADHLEEAVEQAAIPDGVPEGADRVGGTAKKSRGGRVRTRRRGGARRGAADDAADKTSVDGEQEA